MSAITLTSQGDADKTQNRLHKLIRNDLSSLLSQYGELGVLALSSTTPIDTGKSKASWVSKVEKTSQGWKLSWKNQNRTVTGEPIVLLLQYGHGTGTGGYVAGRDFINPAIKPVFDLILADLRRKVTR